MTPMRPLIVAPGFLSGTSNSSVPEADTEYPCLYQLGPPGKSYIDSFQTPSLPSCSLRFYLWVLSGGRSVLLNLAGL